MLKATIFREYDIRGVADVELVSGDIEVLGQAFGTYLRRHAGRKINLARDTRLSSPRLRDALMRGLKTSGCDVTDLGVVPTPVLYCSVFHLQADGGVMITGSHNPPEFNGFKTVCGESTIHGEAIQELYRLIRTGDLDRGEGSEKTYDAVTPYVNEVAGQFHFPRRIRVVVDAGNGTGGPVMHRILERLNADAHFARQFRFGLFHLGLDQRMAGLPHDRVAAARRQVVIHELSGHMFFADRYYGFDDALYAACRLMEIVANSGRPLSAQLEDLPRTVTTPEIRFDCPDELKFQVVKLAAAELQSRHQTLDVDGVRVLFPQGWGLVRASNTQPVLVMRFEATTPALLRQYQDEVEAVVRSSVERSTGVQPVVENV
jgi:phosphomannomutase